MTFTRRSLVVGIAVLGAAAVLWPSVFPGGKLWNYTEWTWRAYTLLGNAATLAGAALAVLLAWRARHPAALHLGASLGLAAIAFGAGTGPDLPWAVPDGALRALSTGVAVLAMAGFVRFTALFPRRYAADPAHDDLLLSDDARTPLDRLFPTVMAPLAHLVPVRVRSGARRGWAAYRARVDRSARTDVNARAAEVRRAMLRTLSARAWPMGAAGAVPLGAVAGLAPDWVLPASYVVVLPAFMAAYLLLKIGYATGSDVERREVLWIVQGFTFLLVAPALIAWSMMLTAAFENPMAVTLGALLPAALALGGCAMVASLAIAVFGAGALDPGAALRRTVGYGALGIIATLVFEVMENLASDYVVSLMGLSGDRAVWISSGAAAIVFSIAHQRIAAGMVAGGVEGDGGVEASAGVGQGTVTPPAAGRP